MDVAVQDIEETPDVAPEETPREDSPLADVAEAPAEEAEAPLEAAAPKRKPGRPRGSKNKPRIIEQPVPQAAPQPAPEIEQAAPEPVRPVRRRRQPAEAPAASSAFGGYSSNIQTAAMMLEMLRQEQAERAQRKANMYRSWIQ